MGQGQPGPVAHRRPRLAAGRRRHRRHLGGLPGSEQPVPVPAQPGRAGRPDLLRRPDLPRHRDGAAARRDRPVGRVDERPVRVHHGRALGDARLEPDPRHRRRRGRRRGPRRRAGLPVQPVPHTVVRRHAGRAARARRPPTEGAGRHRDAEPAVRRHGLPADQQALRPGSGLHARRDRGRRLRAGRAGHAPPALLSRPHHRADVRAGLPHRRAGRRRVPHHLGAGAGAGPAAGVRHLRGVRRPVRPADHEDHVRPARVRGGRQRRGGPAGRHQHLVHPHHGVRHRRRHGRPGRDDERRLHAVGQPVLRRQRPAALQHRGGGHRRHQPLRRARQRLVGAARLAGDRVDLQRHVPARAEVQRPVHGHRRGAAGPGAGGSPAGGPSHPLAGPCDGRPGVAPYPAAPVPRV